MYLQKQDTRYILRRNTKHSSGGTLCESQHFAAWCEHRKSLNVKLNTQRGVKNTRSDIPTRLGALCLEQGDAPAVMQLIDNSVTEEG